MFTSAKQVCCQPGMCAAMSCDLGGRHGHALDSVDS